MNFSVDGFMHRNAFLMFRVLCAISTFLEGGWTIGTEDDWYRRPLLRWCTLPGPLVPKTIGTGDHCCGGVPYPDHWYRRRLVPETIVAVVYPTRTIGTEDDWYRRPLLRWCTLPGPLVPLILILKTVGTLPIVPSPVLSSCQLR